MKKSVLLLNTDYTPMHVCSMKRAMQLLLSDKVEIIEADGKIRCVSSSFDAPSVIRLRNYVYKPYVKIVASKRNIFARDKHECQYCGNTTDLTLDHVIPRSKGGQSNWENLVTCCKHCNSYKGDRTPEQAGMSLRKKPRKPANNLYSITRLKDSWKTYILN